MGALLIRPVHPALYLPALAAGSVLAIVCLADGSVACTDSPKSQSTASPSAPLSRQTLASARFFLAVSTLLLAVLYYILATYENRGNSSQLNLQDYINNNNNYY